MFKLNPNAKISFHRVGHEEQPLLVIDDLLQNPQELVEYAKNANWKNPKAGLYPGIIAEPPMQYLQEIALKLKAEMCVAFNFPAHLPLSATGFFALTTKSLDDFDPWQRIPHLDQTDADSVAMVHYLNPNQTGGTGFFRHIPSGYESVSQNRHSEYVDEINAWFATDSDKLTDYAGPNTPNFEMIHNVPFKFNRALIYPSYVLHCALYDGSQIDANPETGRLTANSFWIPKYV